MINRLITANPIRHIRARSTICYLPYAWPGLASSVRDFRPTHPPPIGLTYELALGQPGAFPQAQPIFGTPVLDTSLTAPWLLQLQTRLYLKLKDPGFALPAGLNLTIQVRNYRYSGQAGQPGNQLFIWSQPLANFLLPGIASPFSIDMATLFPNLPRNNIHRLVFGLCRRRQHAQSLLQWR